jgi:hypothetical protein
MLFRNHHSVTECTFLTTLGYGANCSVSLNFDGFASGNVAICLDKCLNTTFSPGGDECRGVQWDGADRCGLVACDQPGSAPFAGYSFHAKSCGNGKLMMMMMMMIMMIMTMMTVHDLYTRCILGGVQWIVR